MGAEVSVLAPVAAEGTGHTGKTPKQMERACVIERERPNKVLLPLSSLIYDPKPFFEGTGKVVSIKRSSGF